MKILIIGMLEKFQEAVDKAIANLDEMAIFDDEIFIKKQFSEIDGVVFCDENDENIKQAKMCKNLRIPFLFCICEKGNMNAFRQPVVVLCDDIAPLEVAKIKTEAERRKITPLIENELLMANHFAQKIAISGPNITITSPRVWIVALEMLEHQSQELPPLVVYQDTR